MEKLEEFIAYEVASQVEFLQDRFCSWTEAFDEKEIAENICKDETFKKLLAEYIKSIEHEV